MKVLLKIQWIYVISLNPFVIIKLRGTHWLNAEEIRGQKKVGNP